MAHDERKAEVGLGDGVVTIKIPGRSEMVVAKILGAENDEEQRPRILWLDRLVHTGSYLFEGWEGRGAISTVLVRERG